MLNQSFNTRNVLLSKGRVDWVSITAILRVNVTVFIQSIGKPILNREQGYSVFLYPR